ncbi:K02A2.6-like, partial [Cordylochernes scorpioides]
MKPSQLLQKLRSLATKDISDILIKTLWLEKLPDSMKNILLVSDENVTKLASMADKIMDMTFSPDICSASSSHTSHTNMENLLEKISSLERQVSEINSSRSRPTSKNQGHRFSRSRSQSRRNGADVSIVPPIKNEKRKSDYKLYAANGSEIETYGVKILTLDLGLRRGFQWPFVVAKKSEKATPRQLRQLQFISQFSTDIRHNKGQDNIVADALSRIEELTLLDYDGIAERQRNDEELRNLQSHRKRRQFKQTDAFTRGMVIGLKRAGWSIRQIAADTHLGASTVHRLWRRWLEQGNVAIYRNAGATRVTSARVDRRILRQAVAAPQATCTAILQHVQDTLDHSISTRTISRRLVANGLHSCRPLRRLPLTPPNRRQRLEWCRARSTWMTEWHRVVFSDVSRFCLPSDSRRVRVWRRRGERPNPAAIVERPTVRQRGIMVWGAIAYDSRSPLLRIQGTMTAQRYVDDVLRPVTLPYLQGVPNALYQQDNARPHTARISQQALQDVQMLPWPPYSPDLSPIEHVWDIIGRRLHALPQPRSEDELWQMVEREWRAIPQDAIRTLIDSLPRRVAACIAVRDGLPNDWKDLIVAAQPTDATKWFHIAASIEQNRVSIQFKPKNKIHLATKNNDNRKNVCPFWCPICSKKGIKIKHWVTDCEDYDPNYKKDRPNQNTSVKQVCGAPELLNVSTLTNTPTQGAFKLINISVEVNGIPAQAFVDTGATVSIINWRLFKRTRLQLQPNSDIHISQPDGVTRTCGSLQTKVRIDKLIKPVTLHVMKNFKYPLLIGLDVASLFNLLIDVKDKTIYTKFDGLQNPILVNHLEEIREHELKKLLEHNRNVFCQHAIDLGKVAIQHKIITKSEQPISLRPYRRPLKEYEEIAEQVKELLEHKLIRTSDSPWAFPVVMVPKKDGNKRMCIDYRRLNEITLDDRQPLPHIQDMFDRLHGSRFFSTLDVAWGYWQIEMDPQSIQKTAFVTNDGHYEYLVMPFGLKNAASTFQRIIQHILGKLKSIQDFPRPDTVKKVRQFMGLANYYRKFVKDFSKISFPLVRLTRKNQPFIWNEEVEESFAKLKMALSTKPVLAIYNPDYPSKVYTDASKYGIGAILTQIGPDNEKHVIAYYSKTLQPHQENYSAYEMECLAVIQATDHFHVYIENQPFEIITDHAALQWLFTMKKPKPKYFMWILSLSSKSCNIIHRSGKQQTHVDALSRLPVVNIATQELQEHQQNSDLSFLKNSHTHDSVVMIKQKGVFKAVVPNSLTKKILEEYHDSLSHPSITKTCKLITQCYWWKGITTDIKNYVRSCKSCQLVKVRHEPTLGEMITPTSNIQPLQMIGCDTIVLGTAAANTKHKFIQLFVDHATRYLWAYPTITNTAQAVTQCLDKIIKSVNSINTILTDNDKNFISKEFNKFLSLQGIKHTYTSPYHPQCNGICEKLNDTIMTKLRIAVLEKPRCKWSTLLPQVVKNYNSTPHDVTGFSPLFLMYGIGNVPEFADQTPITIEEARKKASLRTEQIRKNPASPTSTDILRSIAALLQQMATRNPTPTVPLGAPPHHATKIIQLPKLASPEELTMSFFRDWKQRWNDYVDAQQVATFPLSTQQVTLRAALHSEWTILWQSGRLHISTTTTLDEAMNALEAYLRKKRNPLLDRQDFHRRDQQTGESVDRYFAALKALDDSCAHELDFKCSTCGDPCITICTKRACGKTFALAGYQQQLRIRDRLICGLFDKDLQRKVLAEQYNSDLSLDRVLSICIAHESATAVGATLSPSPTTSPEAFIATRRAPSTYKHQQASSSETSPKANRFFQKPYDPNDPCSGCGANPRHRRDQCPAKDIECNKCGITGHYGRVCRQLKRKPITKPNIPPPATRNNQSQPGPSNTVVAAGVRNELITITTDINHKLHQIRWLADSGSDLDLIPESEFLLLDEQTRSALNPKNVPCVGANGISLSPCGSFVAALHLNGKTYSTTVGVCKHLNAPLLSKSGCKALGLLPDNWPHSMIVNAITNGQVLTFPPTPVRANEIDKQSILTHYARAFDDTVLKPMQGPPMSIEIVKDAVVKTCAECSAYLPSQQKEPLYSDPPPSYPFQHVSCDLFSHVGYQYLVMVDRFSGWINVTQCGRAPTSTTVIRHLQKWMADYGIPEILTSDNGPQFSSQEFRSWTKRWNIEHSTSSPHFPQSNGLAEAAVKAIKYLISKTTTNGNLKSDTFLESLMEFRNTPKAEGRSPAQIVFGAPTRTKLPLHRSQFAKEWRTRISECDQRAQNLRQKALKRYNRNAKPLSQLEVGAIVLVQDHRTKHWTLLA